MTVTVSCLCPFSVPTVSVRFPTTVTGKLQKFRMREMALEKMGQETTGRT